MLKLEDLPVLPQRQDDLSSQLLDLRMVANRLGMYDAADAVSQIYDAPHTIKYGCHVDLDPGMEPDGCVIDSGNIHDCHYAKSVGRKERCEYWKIVSKNGGSGNETGSV